MNCEDNVIVGELGSQYSPQVLAHGLTKRDRVVYTNNGNRATSARSFLGKLEQVCSRVGIRRVADISFLGGSSYPVYQSCRPNILFHIEYGQNTCSQGKGTTSAQAKISCIMEAIEAYCAEPRHAHLVRASYRFLSGQHVAVDPRKLVTRFATDPPSIDEPIMWTPAFSVKLGEAVWLPAQLVYYPFVNEPYRTRSLFPSGSNGLASGSTYLEAATHGLYELIERYYIYRLHQGEVQLEAMFEHEVTEPSVRSYLRRLGDDGEVQLYSVALPEGENLPVIMCCVVVDNTVHQGWGCSSSVEMSISRAFSEAMQSHATQIAGAREDIHLGESGDYDALREVDVFGRTGQPDARTLTLEDLRGRVHDRDFATLDEEYSFIVAWLCARGFDNILLANLTRHGIDIPVVKAIVAGLEMPNHFKARTSKQPVPSCGERQFRNM